MCDCLAYKLTMVVPIEEQLLNYELENEVIEEDYGEYVEILVHKQQHMIQSRN